MNTAMPPDTLAAPCTDYRAQIVTDLLSGRSVVHIEYRFAHGGRFYRFYLVPDEGESFASVTAKLQPAIAAHYERNDR